MIWSESICEPEEKDLDLDLDIDASSFRQNSGEAMPAASDDSELFYAFSWALKPAIFPNSSGGSRPRFASVMVSIYF